MIKLKKLLLTLVVMTLVISAFTGTARAQEPEADTSGEKSDKELNAEFCEAHPTWCEPSTIFGSKVDITACRADLALCCNLHPIRCKNDPIGDGMIGDHYKKKQCQPVARDALEKLDTAWKRMSFFTLKQPAGYNLALLWAVFGVFMLSWLAIGKNAKRPGKRFVVLIIAALVVLIVLRTLLVGVELRGLMGTTLIDYNSQCSQFNLIDLAQDEPIIQFDLGLWERIKDSLFSGWKYKFPLWLAEGDDPGWIKGVACIILGVLLLITIYHWKWWKDLNVVRKIGFGALAGYIVGTFSLETAKASTDERSTSPDTTSAKGDVSNGSSVLTQPATIATNVAVQEVKKVSVMAIIMEIEEEEEEGDSWLS